MTDSRKITQRKTDRLSFGVKTEHAIARGAMVGLGPDGWAVEALESGGLKIVGVAATSVDNKDRPDGELRVQVEREVAYRFDNDPDDPVKVEDLFKPVYASGPFSITKTDDGATRSFVGTLVEIEDTWAWVRIG